MSGAARTKRSVYMEWAKTRSHARFNLATSGLMSVPLAEFPVRLEQLEITAPGAYGYTELQKKLAQHCGVAEDCVVAATGTSMANHLAMAAVLDPGDEVLIEQPVYGPLLDVAEYLGAHIRRIPRRFGAGFVLDPAEIEKAITAKTRLIVLSNLHNPSGALMPDVTLRAIGKIAKRAGARVLVDEVYLEMLFDGSPPHCFPIGQTISEDNPFVVTSSLTKVYGLSGLRCGWILAAPALAKRMWLLNDLYGAVAAHAAERMSVIAFEHLGRFRERARALLTANRALLDAFLDSRSDLECFRPPAGTVVFPRLKRGDAEAFFDLLRQEYETTVVPGRFFEMPQHFRIGIGGDTATLKVGLERLSAALDKFARR
ncbi:MAG TPA: pyridoxal phosphate-dependent aminotransferase [Candidatus Methylomirabilis sp.]|nr:pyridoxal phosphate-dependent aminotransferase [Candidatus Methylomirabilis sp.]